MHVLFWKLIFFAIFFFGKLQIAEICLANFQTNFVLVLFFHLYNVGQRQQEIVWLSLNITSQNFAWIYQGRGRTGTETAKKQLQSAWQWYSVQHYNAIIPSQHAALYKLKLVFSPSQLQLTKTKECIRDFSHLMFKFKLFLWNSFFIFWQKSFRYCHLLFFFSPSPASSFSAYA